MIDIKNEMEDFLQGMRDPDGQELGPEWNEVVQALNNFSRGAYREAWEWFRAIPSPAIRESIPEPFRVALFSLRRGAGEVEVDPNKVYAKIVVGVIVDEINDLSQRIHEKQEHLKKIYNQFPDLR